MRVGIVCYPSLGGSGIVATELGIALAERGHEIHFISSDAPVRLGPLSDKVRMHLVEVPGYPLFKYPPYLEALATKIADVAQYHDLDLIHAHYAMPHALAAYLAREMLAPRPLRVLVTLHGTDITVVGTDPSYLPITRFGMEQADGLTAVSEHLARQTRREIGPHRAIEVIPNFVNTAHYRPAPARETAPARWTLVHASNFRPVKRPLDVIEIFSRVRKRVPARLLLVGEGPDLPAVEMETRVRGLRGEVEFCGVVADTSTVLAGADLFLLPSVAESFGLAALEAMACGVPVIATDAGGLPEVVIDGVCGYLAPVGAVETMAERALLLLTDEERRRRMAQAARARAVQHFERAAIVDRYERCYQDLMARPAAGRSAPVPDAAPGLPPDPPPSLAPAAPPAVLRAQ